MAFYDDLLSAVTNSKVLNPTVKTTTTDFLTTHRAVLEPLGGEALSAFLATLSRTNGTDALAQLTQNMDEPTLLALLQQTGKEMDAAIDARVAATARFEAFAQTLGTAALQFLAQLVVALI